MLSTVRIGLDRFTPQQQELLLLQRIPQTRSCLPTWVCKKTHVGGAFVVAGCRIIEVNGTWNTELIGIDCSYRHAESYRHKTNAESECVVKISVETYFLITPRLSLSSQIDVCLCISIQTPISHGSVGCTVGSGSSFGELPKTSDNFRKLPKTSDNFRKLRKLRWRAAAPPAY